MKTSTETAATLPEMILDWEAERVLLAETQSQTEDECDMLDYMDEQLSQLETQIELLLVKAGEARSQIDAIYECDHDVSLAGPWYAVLEKLGVDRFASEEEKRFLARPR